MKFCKALWEKQGVLRSLKQFCFAAFGQRFGRSLGKRFQVSPSTKPRAVPLRARNARASWTLLPDAGFCAVLRPVRECARDFAAWPTRRVSEPEDPFSPELGGSVCPGVRHFPSEGLTGGMGRLRSRADRCLRRPNRNSWRRRAASPADRRPCAAVCLAAAGDLSPRGH